MEKVKCKLSERRRKTNKPTQDLVIAHDFHLPPSSSKEVMLLAQPQNCLFVHPKQKSLTRDEI